MHLKFLHVVESISSSFLVLSDILLYGCNIVGFIHPQDEGHLDFLWVLINKTTKIFAYRFLCTC